MEELGRIDGAALLEIWRPYAYAAILGFARMLGVISVLPLLAQLGLRGLMRMSVAAGVSTPVILGLVEPVAAEDLTSLHLLGLVAKEVLVGVAIGLLIGLPFWAIELAGGAIDFQRMAATSIASTPDGQSTTIMGLFLGLIYIAWVFVSGAHLLAIGVVLDSFGFWPALAFAPLGGDLSALDPTPILSFLQRLFMLGLLLGAPIIFVLLLSDIAVAALSRFASQMNAMLLAMQVKSLIVGVMLLFYLGVMFTAFREQVGHFFDLSALFEGFAGGGGP